MLLIYSREETYISSTLDETSHFFLHQTASSYGIPEKKRFVLFIQAIFHSDQTKKRPDFIHHGPIICGSDFSERFDFVHYGHIAFRFEWKNTRFFLFTENMPFFDTRWKKKNVWSCSWQTWFIQIRWKSTLFFSFRPYLIKNSCSFTTHNTYCIHTRCKKHLFFCEKAPFFSFRPYLMKNSCSFTTHNTCCIHTRCKKHLFFFMPDIFHSVPVKKRLVSLILPTKKSASYGHAKLYEYVICTALCLAQCKDKGQETADKAATCSPSIVPPTEKNDCTYGGSESPWKAPWKPCAPMEVP